MISNVSARLFAASISSASRGSVSAGGEVNVISRRRRRRSVYEWEKHSCFQSLLSRLRFRNWRETCWRLTSSEGSRTGVFQGC